MTKDKEKKEEKQEDEVFKLNSKRSLFEPIRIEIEGKVYESVKLTRTFIEKLIELDDAVINEKNVDAMFKQLSMIFGVDVKLFEKFEKSEVDALYNWTKEQIGGRKRRQLEEGEESTALILAEKPSKKKD